MARLLVVEDDDTIGKVLATSLRSQGHDVTWARTGADAVTAAGIDDLDLVLLDLGLPDRDGLQVCRQIRALLPVCVLVMLTARTEEMDVVVGLESGADDYLTKPFRLGELLARIGAHLRRARPADPDTPAHTVGDLVVDTARRCCTVGTVEVPLRAREFDLLARLAADPGAAVGRERLMAEVWDENWFGSTKTLDVHVAALRRKLASAATGHTPRIATLRGFGYRLDPPADPPAGPPADTPGSG